ncbi:MAG: ABC transporter substrate-binding protein, partial [Castellaniella sp.]
EEAKKGEQKMRDIYGKAGVEVVTMTPDQYQAWMDIAKKSSYVQFAEKVPGGQALLDKALAVQ